MGPSAFSSQYMQSPLPEDGEVFKWLWVKIYDEKPRRDEGSRVVQSWDMASKAGERNDYSVCTTWLVKRENGRDNYYLLDVFRERLNFPELRQAVYRQEQLYPGAEILIEETAGGIPMLQELQAGPLSRSNRIRGITVSKDKVMRASKPSVMFETGQVWFPRQATWLDPLRSEMLQFPNGRHDDQVDSITLFLGHEARVRNTIREVRLSGF